MSSLASCNSANLSPYIYLLEINKSIFHDEVDAYDCVTSRAGRLSRDVLNALLEPTPQPYPTTNRAEKTV